MKAPGLAALVLVLALHLPAIAQVRPERRPVRLDSPASAIDTFAGEPGSAARATLGEREPIPFPADGREWRRVSSPWFDLLSDADQKTAVEVARDLTCLARRLLATSSIFTLPPGRTRVVLFAGGTDARPYLDALSDPAAMAAGLTLRHPLGSTALIDASSRGGTTAIPRHEMIHDLLHRTASLPLWAEEGLAEYYAVGGRPVRDHIARIRSRLPIPLGELFATTAESPHAASPWFYAESWAAVDALMTRHPAGLFAMLEGVARGEEPFAALRARFAMSGADLDWDMRRTRPAHALQPAACDDALPVTPLPRAALLLALGETLSRVHGHEADASRHLAEALRLAPDAPEILLATARRIGNDGSDPREALDCVLLARDRGAPAAQTAFAAAQAFLALGQREAALLELERLRAADPGDLAAASQLFGMYVERGERQLADDLFPQLAESPYRSEAQRVLLDHDLARASELASAGRYSAAADVLRVLAPAMPPKTRASIETQIGRLEQAAAAPTRK